jgi:hypothetical protein
MKLKTMHFSKLTAQNETNSERKTMGAGYLKALAREALNDPCLADKRDVPG